MKALTLLLIFSFNVFATDKKELLLNQQIYEESSYQDKQNFPEIFQHREALIENRNSDTGIIDDAYFTLSDHSVISINYAFALDQNAPTKIQSFDMSYFKRKQSSYTGFWYGFQVKRIRALYNAVADDVTGQPSREANAQVLNIAGAGVAYRFNSLTTMLPQNKFFERVEFFFNYAQHQDLEAGDQFTGYGYSTHYNFYYRPGKSLIYGVRLGYNQFWLTKPEENDEPLSERSLVLGNLDFGFTVGFYF